MAKDAIPISTVGMPHTAETIAPTVEPDGMSDFEAKVCKGSFRSLQIWIKGAALVAEVA